jgi:hypothetical protein
MRSNRREFLNLFGAASVSAALLGTGAWAKSIHKPVDASLLLKSRGLTFMELGGQRVFAVHGASGGLCYENIFYLHQRSTMRYLGVRCGGSAVPNGDLLTHARDAVIEGVRQFDKASQVVKEGGDLGLGIRYPYRRAA